MKPRWNITNDEIAALLETHGIEVRMWDIEDGVFLGAIVDGQKPKIAQQADSADGEKLCHYDLKCDYAQAGPNCGQCDFYYPRR